MGNTESGPSETESVGSDSSVVSDNVENANNEVGLGEGDRIFQFRINLRGVKPQIWRRVQVPEDFDFLQLHKTLNRSMGWKESHLYEFKAPGKGKLVIGEEDDEGMGGFGGRPETIKSTTVKIGKVFSPTLKKMSYLYDFGDDWYHSLQLEKILPREEGAIYPRCIKGKRACPPEDCGGTDGYEELLESLSDPDHKEHVENKEWLKECGYDSFDAEHFDPDSVNKMLLKI